VQVVRFVAGSLDLGYLYDESEPPPSKTSRRPARWVVGTDGHVTLQEAADERDAVDQDTQTDVCGQVAAAEQVEVGVQTDAAAGRPFSTLRKDLPQFSRPAKHTVK